VDKKQFIPSKLFHFKKTHKTGSIMKILSFILIVAGVLMLIFNSFNFTTKEKVVDAGPIQITADKQNEVNWPNYAGGVVLAVGVVLLFVDRRKK